MNGTEFTTERTKAVSDQSQEVLAVVTHTGPSLYDDQQVAYARRLTIVKATLVQASFSSRNRLVRTRMLGSAGAAVSYAI